MGGNAGPGRTGATEEYNGTVLLTLQHYLQQEEALVEVEIPKKHMLLVDIQELQT